MTVFSCKNRKIRQIIQEIILTLCRIHGVFPIKLEKIMASYWTRKDDQSDEVSTIKPWDEKIGNGDKQFPEPDDDKKTGEQ